MGGNSMVTVIKKDQEVRVTLKWTQRAEERPVHLLSVILDARKDIG